MVVMTLPSCATIFSGTKDSITINSKPEGAMVKINGIDKGTTPCTMIVKRESTAPVVTLEKEGYQIRSFQLEQSFNMVSILNLGNLLGWGIDLLTGAINKYDPKIYELKLDLPKKEPVP